MGREDFHAGKSIDLIETRNNSLRLKGEGTIFEGRVLEEGVAN